MPKSKENLNKLVFESQTAEIELKKINEEYKSRLSEITNRTNEINKQIQLLVPKIESQAKIMHDVRLKIIEQQKESKNLINQAVETAKLEGANEDRDKIIKLGMMVHDITAEFDSFLSDNYETLFKEMIDQEKNLLILEAQQLQNEEELLRKKATKEASIVKEKIDNLKKAIDNHQHEL